MTKKITGYKGFNKGLECRGLKYEVGKTYTIKKSPKLCNTGYHFCENPLDIFDFYDLVNSNGELNDFAKVEASGEIVSDDKKTATNKITIKAKLTLPAFVKASFDFMWKQNNIKDSDTTVSRKYGEVFATSGDYSRLATSGHSSRLATSGDYSRLATSGHSSRLATSGHSSQLATSGDYSRLATSGDYSRLATSGHSSRLATSGDSSRLATSGDYSRLATSGHSSRLATSGDYSQLATSGDYSRLATSGDYSRLATSGHSSRLATSGHSSRLATSGHSSRLAIKGKKSVGSAIGINSSIQGVKGTWITLAEYDSNYEVCLVKSAQIDGKILEANTPYTLKNGEFVKA